MPSLCLLSSAPCLLAVWLTTRKLSDYKASKGVKVPQVFPGRSLCLRSGWLLDRNPTSEGLCSKGLTLQAWMFKFCTFQRKDGPSTGFWEVTSKPLEYPDWSECLCLPGDLGQLDLWMGQPQGSEDYLHDQPPVKGLDNKAGVSISWLVVLPGHCHTLLLGN